MQVAKSQFTSFLTKNMQKITHNYNAVLKKSWKIKSQNIVAVSDRQGKVAVLRRALLLHHGCRADGRGGN